MPGIAKHGVVLTNEASIFSPARASDSVQGLAWDGSKYYVSYSGGSNRISRYNSSGVEEATNNNAATLLNSVGITSLGDIHHDSGTLYVATGLENTTPFIFEISASTLNYITHRALTGITGTLFLNGVVKYGSSRYVGTAGSSPATIQIHQYDASWNHVQVAWTSPGPHEFGIQSLAVWGRYMLGGGHMGSLKVWYIKDDGTLELVQECQDTSWSHAATANMQGIDVLGDKLWILDRVGTGANTGQVYNYDIAEKGSGVWLPTRLDPSTWLDASEAANLTLSGADVVTWKNRAWATVESPTQGTAGNRPDRITAGIDGKDIVRFDNVDDALTFANAAQQKLLSGWTIAVLFAATAAAPATTRALFGVMGAGSVFRGALAVDSSKRLLVGGRRLDGDFFVSVNDTVALDSNPHVLVGVADYGTTTITAFKDGTQVAQSTSWQTSGQSSNTAGDVRVLQTANPYGSDGGEILFLPYAADASTRQLLEGYLAWKWGVEANLPGGHPYLSAAPALDPALEITSTSDSNKLIDEQVFVISGTQLGSATAVTFKQTGRPNYAALAFVTANDATSATLTGLDVQDMGMTYGAATVSVTTAAGESPDFAITIEKKAAHLAITLSGHTSGSGWALGEATANSDTLVAGATTTKGGTFAFVGTNGDYTITYADPLNPPVGDTNYWAWFDDSADQWYEGMAQVTPEGGSVVPYAHTSPITKPITIGITHPITG